MDNNELELQSNLDKIKRTVFREYLYNIQNEYVVFPFDEYNRYENKDGKETIKVVSDVNIKAFKVDRWVFDEKEQVSARFANVYSAFSQRKDAIAMLVGRTMKGADFYFVVRTSSDNRGNEQTTKNALNLLTDSLKGNFPGTIVKAIDSMKTESGDIWKLEGAQAISSVTSISSDKYDEHVSQGLEKLLNGVVPKNQASEYTVIFLAEPMEHSELLSVKNGYETLASSIYGFAEYQSSETLTNAITDGTSWASAHTTGTNRAIAKTKGVNLGVSGSITRSQGWLSGIFKNWKKSDSGTVGVNAGFQYSRTVTEGSMVSDTDTDGTNHCVSSGTLSGETHNFKSYPVSDMLTRIEKQILRLDECEGVGMWRSAAYVLAGNKNQAENVAQFLLGIIQGKDSFVEASVINTWSSSENKEQFRDILKYVSHFIHPVFLNVDDINLAEDVTMDKIEQLVLANYVTSVELANFMSFPYKSVKGLSCIECAEFERNVLYKDLDIFSSDERPEKERRELRLGEIYHMHEFDGSNVPLDIDEFTKHMFITGSTGSGKSTTIYKILHELNEREIPFMVVEPAKGEYCKEFEGIAIVYTTNYNYGELLHINPFYFPAEGKNRIMVSEHIDRLVEIFNVCWPMYAAMPAVLKEALERAYEEAGWDLSLSINTVDSRIFPTFVDLLTQLRIVIKESDYSEEVKSNYTGSLVTRVKSLTNGIFRQIFTSQNIQEEELFKKKVIIDISKVGAVETKALIMGLLVMRMQEYHMAFSSPVDKLEHITVLEEAHNLLKRTSSEQLSESSNVIGKSVEMISNAIAEMRTYGEGFIIADQAPGLLDESVIRNTNTKIILSLPDYSDRELVGKSIGLTEKQINEITRFPKGKGVVYQNNWVAPVLCAIKAYTKERKKTMAKSYADSFAESFAEDESKSIIINTVIHNKIDEIDRIDVTDLLRLDIPVTAKVLVMKHINERRSFEKQEKIDIVYDFYASELIKNVMKKTESNLTLIDSYDKESLHKEFEKWISVLDIRKHFDEDDVMGIINIILYRMKSVDNIELEQCERLFGAVSQWR